jgi:hypothetical protein
MRQRNNVSHTAATWGTASTQALWSTAALAVAVEATTSNWPCKAVPVSSIVAGYNFGDV